VSLSSFVAGQDHRSAGSAARIISGETGWNDQPAALNVAMLLACSIGPRAVSGAQVALFTGFFGWKIFTDQ